MNCVESVVTVIMTGFCGGRTTLALALDIVSFLISKRNIFLRLTVVNRECAVYALL